MTKMKKWISPRPDKYFDCDKPSNKFLLDEVGCWNSASPIKTLHLTLKRKWFDMIVSGIKKEEYREIKPHWEKRLICGTGFYAEGPASQHNGMIPVFVAFDNVSANNGYKKNGPNVTWQHKGIRIGTPNPEWCEPEDIGKQVFILDIGLLISHRSDAGTTTYGEEWIKIFNYSDSKDCR